jgi:GT2 family glycosyltransferase
MVAQCSSQPGPAIRLVQNPGRLSSCGRNAGVTEASGEIIIFSDGHCQVPSRTLLRDAADLFACSDADILCRPQPLNFPGNTNFQSVVAAARASWLGHGRDSTIYATDREGWVDPSSAGAMYRRSLFEQFGGFDERFDACEDVEFNHRLHQSGIKAYISPKLTVFYEPRKTLSSLFQQMVRYGRGRVRLSRKHPSAASLAQLVPVALVLLVILLPVMPFTPFFRIWLVLVGTYFATVISESARISFRLGVSKFPTIALVFCAIHLGLGTGLIIERVAGKSNSPARVPLLSARSTKLKDVDDCADSSTSTPQEIGRR